MLTIGQHIMQQQRKFPGSTGDLSDLLYDIALAGKIVSREVNRAGLVNILGTTGQINIQDEEVQKLDIFANSIFLKIFENSTMTVTVPFSTTSKCTVLNVDMYLSVFLPFSFLPQST